MKRLFTLLVLVASGAFIANAQNTATVNQTGDDNAAAVAQAGSGNEAVVTMGVAGQTSQNGGTTVDQSGATNQATVFMSGDQGLTGVLQSGSANEANIQQIGGELNRANIDQIGSENEATVNQDGDRNYARSETQAGIRQVGDYNVFSVDQYGVGTNPNRARMRFTGDSNTGSLVQGAAGAPTSSDAYLDVLGDHNTFMLRQSDEARHSMDVDVTGNLNTVSVTQSGFGGNHIATVNVNGSGNTATVTQGN